MGSRKTERRKYAVQKQEINFFSKPAAHQNFALLALAHSCCGIRPFDICLHSRAFQILEQQSKDTRPKPRKWKLEAEAGSLAESKA